MTKDVTEKINWAIIFDRASRTERREMTKVHTGTFFPLIQPALPILTLSADTDGSTQSLCYLRHRSIN